MKKIVLLLILLPIYHIYCQDIDYSTLSEKEIVKIIDESLANRDKNIEPIFQTLDVEDPNYKRFEAYVLKYVKEVVDSDDLDYPLYLVESVLYNNLENEDAQELYTIIINRQIEIKERKIVEEVKEEEKEEEIEEIVKVVEEKYSLEEELQNRFSNVDQILNSIPSNMGNNRYRRYVNHTFIYPFSMSYYKSDVYDDFVDRESTLHSIRGYGFTAAAESISGVGSLRGDISVVGNYTDGSFESAPNVTGDVLVSGGFRGIYVPIYISAGYYLNYFHYEDIDDSLMAIKILPSPIVGLSIMDFKFLKAFQLDLGAYPLIAPLYTDSLDMGILLKGYLTINNLRVSKYSFEIRGGVDYLILDEGGLLETYFQPKVGLGVSIYE